MVEQTLHASCVAIDGRGVLITGPSGSGKSSLALRLIDQPGYGVSDDLMTAKLVGDDQIKLTRQENVLFADPAQGLEGLLEVRGLGVVRLAHLARVSLKLVVCLDPGTGIERLPASGDLVTEVSDVALATIKLDAAHPAAPAVVRAALTALCDGQLLGENRSSS